MSDLPQLVALARLLDRLKNEAPNEMRKFLPRFDMTVTSEEAKSLGRQMVHHYENPQDKQVDDEKIQAILKIALG
jgi:hypothetical protein